VKMNDPVVTPEWHDLTDAVHSFGAKIICQLHHGGNMAVPDYCGGVENISASRTGADGNPFPPAREMTTQEAKDMIQKFIRSAKIAASAGLDGVEIHAAHAYLINQFLSPAINCRTDEYGGSFENRARFLLEIIRGVREVLPRPFLLSVRLASLDHVPGGITIEDGAKLAGLCEEAGADLINCSIGLYTTVAQSTESQYDREGVRVPLSEAAKKAVTDAKVAIVGKLRTPSYCEELIANEQTDLVCLGRQLICDPFWPQKVEEGRENEIRPCLNCDEGCLGQFYFHHGNVHCSINPYVGYEDLWRESEVQASGQSKHIVIVGAGIAGMQAAIIANKKGHKVTLVDKAEEMGGQFILASKTPHKESVAQALDWFRDEVRRQGVDVRLGADLNVDGIAGLKPDTVLVAAGATPFTPPIDGIERAVESWDILSGKVELPKNREIVIIGGGVVGSETAHLLTKHGNTVTILEMLPDICIGHEVMHRGLLMEALTEAKVDVRTNAKVKSVGDDKVTYLGSDGKEQSVACNYVIAAVGQRPAGEELYRALKDRCIRTYKIGDSLQIGNFRSATRSALEVANIV